MKFEENANPRKIVISVEKEYWECLDSKHRHTTRIVAANCIDRNRNKKIAQSPEERRLRWIILANSLLDGDTIIQAAQKDGSSSNTVIHKVHALFRELNRYYRTGPRTGTFCDNFWRTSLEIRKIIKNDLERYQQMLLGAIKEKQKR